MTVTFLSILRGFRKPDGVLCHYPVFSLDSKRFFPSHLIAIDEEVMTRCFLSFSAACFNRLRAEPVNPMLSPIHAPTSLIRQLPPCKFIVAQIDALRDQAFHMALRILKTGGQAQIVVMEEFIHGFQLFDTKKLGVSEFKNGTSITTKSFKKLYEEGDVARKK